MKYKVKDLFDMIKYRKKINTLNNQVETLENIIKDDLYMKFMESFFDTNEINKLKKENKKLRENIKILKNIIKEKD